MNYALMLDDAVFGALDAATLVAIPAEWADVKPASPLPWQAWSVGIFSDVVKNPDPEDPNNGNENVAESAEHADAAYIVASCNDRPAMLAKLAEQAATITELTDEAGRLRGVLELIASGECNGPDVFAKLAEQAAEIERLRSGSVDDDERGCQHRDECAPGTGCYSPGAATADLMSTGLGLPYEHAACVEIRRLDRELHGPFCSVGGWPCSSCASPEQLRATIARVEALVELSRATIRPHIHVNDVTAALRGDS